MRNTHGSARASPDTYSAPLRQAVRHLGCGRLGRPGGRFLSDRQRSRLLQAQANTNQARPCLPPHPPTCLRAALTARGLHHRAAPPPMRRGKHLDQLGPWDRGFVVFNKMSTCFFAYRSVRFACFAEHVTWVSPPPPPPPRTRSAALRPRGRAPRGSRPST